jgi:UDP-glucose 4-epimerase
MRRVVITGSSGALGRRLIESFRHRDPAIRILGTDLREPRGSPPDEFVQGDIVRLDLVADLSAFAPDTIIHTAFAFQPLRDDRRMRQVNVEGAKNLLRATAAIRPPRLLVVSSATAYGAWPDNPIPMDEEWPLRAPHNFRYAADKMEVERHVSDFADACPDIAVSVVRPSLIGGPSIDNYIIRMIARMPILTLLDGVDAPLQFVHEDDVVAAIREILESDGRGAYNIAPRDWVLFSEVARAAGRSCWSMPFWLARALLAAGWALRLPWHEAPASFLQFLRHPWVVAPARLERELGFRFRYSSAETIRQWIESWQRE